MTPQEFCYWLQGLLELQPDLKDLNESQVKMIRDHLGYVFTHLNPASIQQTITTIGQLNKTYASGQLTGRSDQIWIC